MDDSKGRASQDKPRHDNTTFFKREIHFIIESPDGEQMPMRYKPEMTVNTAFHFACKKFNVSADDHYLVLNNKEMDFTEHLRNYNIVNNSVIKMFEGRKVSETPDVFVSVQIRDCRIGSVFRATDNVWDILSHLLAEKSYDPEMVPIVIFKKNEFIGIDVLKDLRLRDFGATKGSCLLRFFQLMQEDLDQRKVKEDDEGPTTLESLELKATGTTADGGKSVHFKINEDATAAEDQNYIGERRALAFRIPDPESILEEIQEEYFDLMLEEIQSLFRELKYKKIVGEYESAKEARATLAELKKLRNDFDETLIRIIFPDRICIQCLFLPEENIYDVREFTTKFLKSQEHDFDLYIVEDNGKTLLDDSSSLSSLGMVPTGRIYYEPKDQRFPSIEQYLTDEVTLNVVPYLVGKDAALMLRSDSLDKFMDSIDQSRGTVRKSGGFLSKFVRGSMASSKGSDSVNKSFANSKSQSKYWKQSSFNPKSRSIAGNSLKRSSDEGSRDSKEMDSSAEQKPSP